MMGIPSQELQSTETDIFTRISPHFDVQDTKYGGKGCFSYNPITAGTTILVSKTPISTTIAKDFKKEVCNYCFHYNEGVNMKHKLGLDKFNQYLYFCSPDCVAAFEALTEPKDIFLKTLLTLDLQYNNGLKKDEKEFEDSDLLDEKVSNLSEKELLELVSDKWSQVDTWTDEINKMKPTKWGRLIPKITEPEYLEIKYIIGVLYQMYKNDCNDEPSDRKTNHYLSGLSAQESMRLEMSLFDHLQSNETLKILKYPIMLQSYINIYKYVKLTSPTQFQKFINPSNIRLIIGRNLTNAFGIWSLNLTGNKEFFGFGVYPSASFFNHSCAPNLIKKRIGNELHFIALKDIDKDEELCIDYGNYLNEPVHIRRQQLKEWFFDCGCSRCVKEMTNTS